MPRLLILSNPAASQFTGGLHRRVVEILRTSYEVVSAWPGSPRETQEMAYKGAGDGFDVVVAFGGDGVVHHVANGLVGSTTALGIIPAGTTNVLARILRLPSNPRKAAQFLADDPPLRHSPLAAIRAGGELRYAVFATGIGYDAAVVVRAEQEPYRKYRFGGVHYARSAASVLLGDYRRRPANLRVSDGDRSADGVAVFVQIHQPYTYFGRVPLVVSSTAPVGLAVMTVESLELAKASRIALSALRGAGQSNKPGVSVWMDVEHLTIEAEPPAPLQADGELLGMHRSIEVSAYLHGLLVAAVSPGRPLSR